MPIRELKADLQRRGVPCEDCFEKTDLVDRFLSASPHPGAVVSRDQRLSALVDVNAGSGSVLQIFRFHASWSVSKGLLIVHNLLFPESARPHEPIPLILDTGADACVVSPEVAHKFGAKPTGQTVEGWDPFGVVVASDLIHFGPITAGAQRMQRFSSPVSAAVFAAAPELGHDRGNMHTAHPACCVVQSARWTTLKTPVSPAKCL